jgi:hypothetical protein
LFSNTLSLCSSLNVREQVPHPYRTIFKIIVLYILIFVFRQQTRGQKVLDQMVASITGVQSPLNFLRGLFPSGIPTKTFMHFSSMRVACPVCIIFLDWSSYYCLLRSPSLHNILQLLSPFPSYALGPNILVGSLF